MSTPPRKKRFSLRWARAAIAQAAFAIALACAAPATSFGAPKIVVLGDSLVAGYGISQEEAFPARLQAALDAAGRPARIVNAGVSGDTTAGGLARLDWSVPDDADAVIVELGANDALRGVPPSQTRENLDRIVSRLKQRGMDVLIAGMLAPPNMGAVFEAEFNSIFPQLAEKHDALLYPFFLEGVAADPTLNQGDAMHPNPAGVERIVENFLPVMNAFLDRLEGAGPGAAAD